MVATYLAALPLLFAGSAGESCYGSQSLSYKLDWSAKGDSFLDGFSFQRHSPTGGVADYVDLATAHSEGLVTTHEGNTTRLRTGMRQGDGRRHSVRIESKNTWKYFLAALKFKHVPYGAGVWPAFWLNGVGRGWPNGGELDVLEYANMEKTKVSLHTGDANRCKLHPGAVNKCAHMPDMNKMDYDCKTDYRSDPDHPKLGCGPTHANAQKTGHGWSDSPGVMIAEVTAEFAKVFYIPEHEVPADLSSDEPKPETWDKWVVSYYPFAESERLAPGTCPNPAEVLAPQRIIINTELCGDWAGYTWEPESSMPDFQGWVDKKNSGHCKRYHDRAADDCCNLFMNSVAADEYLQTRGFWDIEYLKVFTNKHAQALNAVADVVV